MKAKKYLKFTGLALLSIVFVHCGNGKTDEKTSSEAMIFKAQETNPPFATDGKGTLTDISYETLVHAEKPWNISVVLPHMKDAYFLGVDYGVIDQAKRMGVNLTVVEAGGYTNLNKQISQIEDAATSGANAIIIASISGDGLNSVIDKVSEKGIPMIDFINGISSSKISAKSLVSFYTMGNEIGKYLAKKHPAGSGKVKVGWFPGPAGAGWVEAANKGFMDAIVGSDVEALPPKYGDTGKEVQLKLVEDVLQSVPDIKYIAGTAVTAEASQGLIKEKGLDSKISLLAFYMTPGVYDGIKSGQILAAPADYMVLQGRIAVDQAVRILEKKPYVKHVGPKIVVVDGNNIKDILREDILPPANYKPEFSVKAE